MQLSTRIILVPLGIFLVGVSLWALTMRPLWWQEGINESGIAVIVAVGLIFIGGALMGAAFVWFGLSGRAPKWLGEMPRN